MAGAAFMDALQLATNLANVGDSRTLVLHPASTTHSRLDAKAMQAAGIGEDLIRVSVGIESFRDIKNDLNNGLRAAQRVLKKAAQETDEKKAPVKQAAMPAAGKTAVKKVTAKKKNIKRTAKG